MNHDKWKELKVEEIRTDSTEPLKNALERIAELEKENAELKVEVEISYEVYNHNLDYSYHIEKQLTEAKEVIEELYNIIPASMSEYAKEPMEHARKFMTEKKND